jgi:3-phosphoshikimate 1-carboxyvinyltransferase
MQSRPAARPLTGIFRVPGDKSISHRALILASQAIGGTSITGLLEGEDVINTARALGQLGVRIKRGAPGEWHVQGVGAGGLSESSDILDMGNSGTGARLLMGLASPYPFTTFFTGDESLRRRPMKRVTAPLAEMGARFEARDGGRLPLAVHGVPHMLPIEYRLPVASAQVKSAILLAALNIAGTTTVVEPQATRDHTERMLRHFGWQVGIRTLDDGSIAVSLAGQQMLSPAERGIIIPGDPSSAAFPAVAALIVPGSDITLENITVNPLRTGLYTTLAEMGADISFHNRRISAGEEVADMRVRHSRLKGVTVPAERAPSMIDEYPVLAVAASYAEGRTVMQGLSELKVKESDRLQAIAAGLQQCGVTAVSERETLTVEGGKPRGEGTVTTHFDHRIAMSALVMGMATQQPVHIDDGSAIATSFPGFAELMNAMGAQIAIDIPCAAATPPASPRPLIIAIDGPASSGKGTLARRLAEHLGYPYLDTGSIYRAVGLKLIYSGKDPFDRRAAKDAALALSEQDFSNPRLRQEKVGLAASVVSAMPEVRKILLDFQRSFARNPKGAILDGRDIGTVVCPDADLKIFITASLETRARRRHRELQGENIEVIYESVLADLRERDERDASRAVAPLIPADDALIIDTSLLDADDVFRQVLGIVRKQSAFAFRDDHGLHAKGLTT